MSDQRKSVTCTERVRMNAVAGLLFLFAGDGLIAFAVLREVEMNLGSIISVVCGIIGMLVGLYCLFAFMNRRIVVSEDGIVYVSWIGKRTTCAWEEAVVSYHLGRNAYFIFMLHGKRVKFYGYDSNAQALFDYLEENDHFDSDTVRMIEKMRDQEKERVLSLQKQARAERLDWGDDVDEDDE